MTKEKTFICRVCKSELRVKAYDQIVVNLKLCPQCFTKQVEEDKGIELLNDSKNEPAIKEVLEN